MAMRMRTTLLLCLVSISFGVVALSLVIVHSILQKKIRSDISADLQRSILNFQNIEKQRRQMLRRESLLDVCPPVLKSLMTTKRRAHDQGWCDGYLPSHRGRSVGSCRSEWQPCRCV